jgi:hypothetical protein
MSRFSGCLVAIIGLCLYCSPAGAAQSLVFDFENDVLPPNPVAVFSVTHDVPSGGSETFSFSKTEDFIQIVDLSGSPGASSFGSHSLAAADSGTNLFTADSSRLLNHFAFDIGAFSTGDLPFTVRAFRDGHFKDVPPGGLLKTITGVLPGDGSGAFHSTTVTLDGLLMNRIDFLAGAPGSQDASYDNFNVSVAEPSDIAVPLPRASLAAIGAGAIAFFAQRRTKLALRS